MSKQNKDYKGNAAFKKEFLGYYYNHPYQRQPKERRQIGRALKWLEPYENKWGMDFCLQTDIEELQAIVNQTSVGAKITILLVLRDYIKWSVNKKSEGASQVFLTLTTPAIESYKYSTISSPAQLQNHLSAIYRPESERTIDNTYRVFFWLAFSGLEEHDAYKVTTDDINLEKMRIEYNGLQLPIYKESYVAFKSCKEDRSFMYSNDNYVTTEIDRPRATGNNLLRGFRVAPSLENRTMRVLTNRRQQVAYEKGQIRRTVAYSRVWRSGIFYKEWVCERQGRPLSFTDTAAFIVENGTRAYKAGEVATMQVKYERILRDLTREYKLWKVAHNL